MIRLGVIGGECSHAEYFAYYFNTKNDKGEYNFPDYRVTAISGHYKKENQEIADKFFVEKVFDNPLDMLDCVDAIMITSRDGKFHYEFVKPFLEKGIPAFIDKPITTDYAQAQKLIAFAKEHGALLCGGTTLKYSTHVLDFAKIVKENRKGVFGGHLVTPVFTDCEWSGFWFYASHLVEVCLLIYGKEIKSLYASNNGGNVSVVFDYGEFSVVGQYANERANCYQMTLILEDGNITNPMVDERNLDVGCEKFIEMLETKKMEESYEDLIYPVFIIEKIIESYTTNKRVIIKE